MIKRHLFKPLQSHLSRKEITLITGPRQAGKTTLMKLLENQLRQEGKKTLFLNLDIQSHLPFFASQETLLQKIELEIGRSKGFVFIDEIQRVPNAGIFLKGLYDLDLPYKFIVSGSGSLELKEQIHESLAGRKRIFELTTLTFQEFVNYKTNYRYENILPRFFQIEEPKAKKLLDEYLQFGGYPAVVTADSVGEKQNIMSEIYQSYLEKDIAYLLKIEKTEAFTHLVKILADQIGNLVTLSEISATLGLSVKTVKHYLWYLEKTFILKKLTPFFRNVRKELTRAPIYYFDDLGLCNYVAGNFGRELTGSRAGFLFQNFVFLVLFQKIANTATDLHFWRTKDRAEVDFVIETGKEITPLEVKFQSRGGAGIPRSMRNFISKYHPARAYIVYLGERKRENLNGTRVEFIPFYDVLFVNL